VRFVFDNRETTAWGVSDSARSWTGWTPRVAFGASRVERVEKSNENGAIAVDLG
jgi:hypothetical protein